MGHKDNKELDMQLRRYRMLTPTQRAEGNRRVIARAHACRAEPIKGMFRQVLGWTRRRAAVGHPHALDDRMLKDIGISRGDSENAARGLDLPERRKAA